MLLKSITNKEVMPKFIATNSNNIPFEKEIPLLCITIEKKLKFDKHVIILCKTAKC